MNKKTFGIILLITLGVLFAVNSVNGAIVKDKITFDDKYTPIKYYDFNITKEENIDEDSWEYDTVKTYKFIKGYSGSGLNKKAKFLNVLVAIRNSSGYYKGYDENGNWGRIYYYPELKYTKYYSTTNCFNKYNYDMDINLVKKIGKGYNKKYKIKVVKLYGNKFNKSDTYKSKPTYKLKKVYKKVKKYGLKNYIIPNDLRSFARSKANGNVVGQYSEYKYYLKTQYDLEGSLGEYYWYKDTSRYTYYKYVTVVSSKYKKVNWKSYFSDYF